MIQRNTVDAAGWHRVSPTPSYSIELPMDCAEDIDDGVYSYFRADDASALQISSYRRTSGEQASARERLNARIARGSAMVLKPIQVSLPYDDYAAARGTDDAARRLAICLHYVARPDIVHHHLWHQGRHPRR